MLLIEVSSRPPNFVNRTGVADWGIALISYGDRWKARRRLIHEFLGERLTASFDEHQYKYAYRFLSRLLEAPESFFEEAELYVTSYPLHTAISMLTHHLIHEVPPEPLCCP